MLPIKRFRLVFCLFRFNQNIKTLCFDIEAKQLNKRFVSDSAETISVPVSVVSNQN
jgi:hypothetical protein